MTHRRAPLNLLASVPSEEDIAQEMRRAGTDRMQAVNTIRCRRMVLANTARVLSAPMLPTNRDRFERAYRAIGEASNMCMKG